MNEPLNKKVQSIKLYYKVVFIWPTQYLLKLLRIWFDISKALIIFFLKSRGHSAIHKNDIKSELHFRKNGILREIM